MGYTMKFAFTTGGRTCMIQLGSRVYRIDHNVIQVPDDIGQAITERFKACPNPPVRVSDEHPGAKRLEAEIVRIAALSPGETVYPRQRFGDAPLPVPVVAGLACSNEFRCPCEVPSKGPA